MTSSAAASPVAAVRGFNRFYTRRIGVLQQGLLDSEFSLTEARVLYELAHRDRLTATELGRDLGLDPGYLSRILRLFQQRGLLSKEPAPHDARQSLLSLTTAGRQAQAVLEERSNVEVAAMLETLEEEQQARVLQAMRTIEELFGARPAAPAPYLLRTYQPGDLGWIVQRNAELYAREYGWDGSYEALVAEIVAKFGREFDPRCERCWIAEREGERLGSVMLVRRSDSEAQLRLLLVEPAARGQGVGRRLVEECIRFARQCGYQSMTLWTNDVLVSARRIYQAAGFELVGEEKHHSFGKDLVGQTWALRL
jgi:DNA-binding MarR family transcriptional regulator/N-acetylglutamate synthase-like GNAT family acetyltransferase